MASPSVDADLEAQSSDATVSQPANNPDPAQAAPANMTDPHFPSGAGPQPQVTNVVPQTVDNTDVQRGENHGDSSDGLWSIYLTEAEKQDKEVTESWKGDTDGILVFTGLFSATVAAFIIESYKKLSPDSGDTTNALLTQISGQLVNISNGTPLVSVVAQSNQAFRPTASAVRVNVFWFLSLVLSLNCALSATLIQQWARRYRELAQRRGATHRRGRMRAYIFNGLGKFGMAQAVATMPTLLHISVFLFFAGLVDFLFPIHTTVAYTTLGCIGVFALVYSNLTVLPNIHLNCPYGTPLSGFTWRISQFSMFGFFWTILKVGGLFRRPLLKLWCLANQHVTEPHGLGASLEKQVKIHRQLFSQGLRKSVELSAYRAGPTVVTSALKWTLTALDEDKEIEDFAARVPGFFDSRVVPDATLAVLSLMSHQPNTDPILGSRLYDLLKTCIVGTSLDEKIRKNRLRICVNCLWYFGRAYNQPGISEPLPSYFPNFLIPEITRRVQAEDDSTLRVIGRCFVALIVNKLAADINSRNVPVSDAELACLSTILSTKSQDVILLLGHPGAIECTSMVFLALDDIRSSEFDQVPLYVLDIVRQTFNILSRALPAELNANMQVDQTDNLMNISDATSTLTAEMYRSVLSVFLKILWYFGRAYNEPGNSVPLPSYVFIAFTNPEMTRRIREQRDLSVRVIGRCVRALVVNKLAADINSRTIPVSDAELACLSAILGTKGHDVMFLLSHPGAIQFTSVVFLALGDISPFATNKVPLDTRHVLQQTFSILSQALPVELNAKMRLDQTDTLMNISDGTSSLTAEMYRSVLRVWMKNLWDFTREYIELRNSVSLPSYVFIAFTNLEMTRRIREQRDLAVRIMGRCVEALVINKLAADINSRTIPVSDAELACLSAILGTKSHDVILLLSHPGAIEFTSVVFLALGDFSSFVTNKVPLYTRHVFQQTLGILSQALPPELNAKMRLDQPDTQNISDGTSSLMVKMFESTLRVWMKNLWHFTREYNEPGNLVSLPSYVCITFTNPEMTRRIHQVADLSTRMIGRCIGALVVNKLTPNAMSHALSVSDVELACLSAILGTDSHDVRLCLSQPGTIELVNLASLVLGDVSSLQVDQMPHDTRSVLQQTLVVLSQALPDQGNAELPLDLRVDQINDSDDTFERIVVSRLHGLLKIYIPGASSLAKEVRTSCLRMCVKSLWHCAKAYHQSTDPLPSYFPLVLATPEITRQFQTEQDHVARITGCCFGALLASKLVDALESPISLSGGVRNAELACISAILGPEHREVLLLPHQLRVVNFRNVVFLMSGEIDTLFTAAGMPADVLNMAQDTLYILAKRLHDSVLVPGGLPRDQGRLLQEIHSDVEHALSLDRVKNETVKMLDRLRQILGQLLPGVE